MHKRAQGSHHASTHLHASTSWAQESTREPSHHSEFDLSSIYQISQAADALAAVDDMGGLAESSAAPVQTVEEILGPRGGGRAARAGHGLAVPDHLAREPRLRD